MLKHNPYWLLAQRDLSLALRHLSDTLMPLLFFALVIVLFPLAIGTSPKMLADMSAGIVWIGVLLAMILSLDRLFRADLQEGFLLQWVTRGGSLLGYVWVRVIISWLTNALPLALLAPLMGYSIGLPISAMPDVLLSLLLGSGAMMAVGAVGSALTTSLPKAGLLLILVILPFYIPVLIFGASVASASAMGLPVAGQLYILTAIWLMSLLLSPLAIAAALKVGIAQT
jgi:heme exporter protein B